MHVTKGNQMLDMLYDTITCKFESHNGSLTLRFGVGPDSTFDDMMLTTYADGIEIGKPVIGVETIMTNLVSIAPLSTTATDMVNSMVNRWPGLRTYLLK
jgi:hypothetical protein